MEATQEKSSQNIWNAVIAGMIGLTLMYLIFKMFSTTVNPLYSVTAGNASVTSTKSCMTLDEAKSYMSEIKKEKIWTYVSEPSEATAQQFFGGC